MITDQLQPLSSTPIQAWMDNRLQLFDVMEFCLEQMGGQAHVTITTFSTSEEFLRRIYKLKEKGLIKTATLLADFKATKKTITLLPFMQNTFDDVFLAENHSKIILLANDKWSISICTSQNQTRGNRVEAGIITTYSMIYNVFYTMISDLMLYKSIRLYDIFNGNSRTNSRVCE